MEKKIFNFANDKNLENMNIVAKAIKEDELVVFPTETVYGIGANAFSEVAVNKIFEAKNRPNDNPLIVHISDVSMLDGIVKNINEIEQNLINNFWPGPFTIILEKTEKIPNCVSCGLNTIGVRMPSNKIAHKLIEVAGVPIAAPSANISGKPSGTILQDIYEELSEKVNYFIDGGKSEIGLESTVVKVENNSVKILRPGKITVEDIEKLGYNVSLSENLYRTVNSNEKVESPGMKHKHYSPSAKCILVSGVEYNVINKINNIINNQTNMCIMGFTEHKTQINSDKYIDIGSKNNLNQISNNIFSGLREVDKLGYDVCIIEGVEKQGLGIAIMNRLSRTCNGNILEV